MKSASERLIEAGYDEIVIFENPSYDDALIGVTTDDRAVYDFNKMVDWLIENNGMNDVEAVEWIEYNSARALPYTEGAPVIMYRLED